MEDNGFECVVGIQVRDKASLWVDRQLQYGSPSLRNKRFKRNCGSVGDINDVLPVFCVTVYIVVPTYSLFFSKIRPVRVQPFVSCLNGLVIPFFTSGRFLETIA